jgi:predicted DCC family thiol-disulfide oxidoreductase YuxK
MFKNSEGAMQKLTVIYDASCGFCVSCRRWLEAQSTYFPFEFVPAGSAAAARLLPGLSSSDAADELLAVGDDGAVYRDAHAWIMCLYALPEYREWAQRLSSPTLLPYARRAFELLSRNRKELSHSLGSLPEPALAETLSHGPSPACPRNTQVDPLPPARGGGALRIGLLAMLLTVLAMFILPRAPQIGGYLWDRTTRIQPTQTALLMMKRQSGLTSQQEAPMQYILWTYAVYLAISIALTVWVARTLHKSGRVFLVDTFGGNETLADSVNHLLVVGFYLINIGYVTLALKESHKPLDAPTSLEMLSSKVGLVLLVLGAMHFFNLYVFSRLRKRALLRHMPPPVRPQGAVPPPAVPRPPVRPPLDAAAGAKA